MAKNNQPKKEEQQKVITKYDRKVQRRKEEQRRAEKEKKITIAVLITAAVVLLVSCIGVTVSNYNKIHKKYIEIDNMPISKIEFDFYYGIAKSDLLNTTLYGTMTYASYFTSYMGYDTGKSDISQSYASSDNTWFDYFANTAVNKIKEYRALSKDAQETGFTYDSLEQDYNSFTENIALEAENAGISVKEAYKELFGSHATENSIKAYAEEYLKCVAYQEELQTKLAASDDEIKAYYDENKDDYDTVDYRSFTIYSDDDDEKAMSAAKSKAEAMAALVTDEASFSQACIQYAVTDEDKKKYADEAASLSKSVSKAAVSGTSLADWLFAQERKEGEITVIEDTDNSAYIVSYFVTRSYDESNDETIANTLLSEKYSELITGYTQSMSVNNIRNRIKMLSE